MGGDLADDFPPREVHCYNDKHQQKTDYQHQLPNTWTHIGGTKANKTLGFVRRNLSECTFQVKCVAYTTLVLPRLEYSSTVWDPHLTSDVHTLEQVQRRAARYPAYPRMCDKHGSEPWVGVPPTTTLQRQAINAFQDPLTSMD